MVSFDVTALFTNISLELILKRIKCMHIMSHFNIPLDGLNRAIELLMDNTFFQFSKEVYYQEYEVSMAAIRCFVRLAAIVMGDMEEMGLNSLDFKPIFYGRYVDDILTILHKNKCIYMLNIFNSYHYRLQCIY